MVMPPMATTVLPSTPVMVIPITMVHTMVTTAIIMVLVSILETEDMAMKGIMPMTRSWPVLSTVVPMALTVHTMAHTTTTVTPL